MFCFDSKLESGYLARAITLHTIVRNGTDWCCLTHRLHMYPSIGPHAISECVRKPLALLGHSRTHTHSHAVIGRFDAISAFAIFLHAIFRVALRASTVYACSTLHLLHISNVLCAHAKVGTVHASRLQIQQYFIFFFVRCVSVEYSEFCCCRWLNWLPCCWLAF